MEKSSFVYIMSNKKHGTLYVGMTAYLKRRIWEHKTGQSPGFTKRYRLTRLVYFEECDSIKEAIYREKQLKRWKRTWKIDLIESVNPEWHDLFPEL